MKGSKKSKTFITNLERALIDIVVSPHYSGGVHNVLNVYKKAINKVSINKIFSMLKELNYSYPYHQSIGFYLDNASSITESKIFKESFPMQFDFYLDHKMQKTEYSEKWRIFYPKDLLKLT